jgi:hypothetical protein
MSSGSADETPRQGSEQASPLVYVHFEAAAGAAAASEARWQAACAALDRAAHADAAQVCVAVRVAGAPWNNVKGKESANLATLPADGPAAAPAGKATDPAGGSSSAAAPDDAPPSAYSHLYPAPQGWQAALAASGSATATICDRVAAELGQVLRSVLPSAGSPAGHGALAPAPVYADGDVAPVVPAHAVHGMPAAPAASALLVPESELAAKAARSWPVVRLAAPGGMPLPRVWEYGVRVSGFEPLPATE